MALSNEIKQKLMDGPKYHRTDEILTQIESSATLVMLLNKFEEKYKEKGHYEYDPKFMGAKFVSSPDGGTFTIVLGGSYIREINSLAHELGQAVGDFKMGDVSNINVGCLYASTEEYSAAMCKGEGEAIFYGYIVSKELKLDYNESMVWLDDETTNTE